MSFAPLEEVQYVGAEKTSSFLALNDLISNTEKEERQDNEQPPVNIFDRLYKENERKKQELSTYEVLRLEKEMQGCTFRPIINSNTQ